MNDRQQQTKQRSDQRGPQQPPTAQLPAVAKTRLPYPGDRANHYELDEGKWRTLVDAIWPNAKTVDAVLMALDYCRSRKLDPMKRVCHIVPVWSTASNRMIETVWPGIAEHRTTAVRTKLFAGMGTTNWGEERTTSFTDKVPQYDDSGNRAGFKDETVTVTYPAWCQIDVTRLVAVEYAAGQPTRYERVTVPGPRVMWLETYGRKGRTTLPNEMWQKRPYGQLEKCTEAAALRRAFPEELGDEWTAEEAGAISAAEAARDVTPVDQQPPPRPTRASVAPTVTDVPADDAGPTPDEAEAGAAELDRRAGLATGGRMPDSAEERGEAVDQNLAGPAYALCNHDGVRVAMLPDGPAFARALAGLVEATMPGDWSALWRHNSPTVVAVTAAADRETAAQLNAIQQRIFRPAKAGRAKVASTQRTP